MTKGRKTGGRDFKPGKSGNPNGSPGLPQLLKDARKLNQVALERVVNQLLHCEENEIDALLAKKDASVFEKIVASILKAAILDADQHKMEWVLQRMLGKVKDQIEVQIAKPFIYESYDGKDKIVMGVETEEEKR